MVSKEQQKKSLINQRIHAIRVAWSMLNFTRKIGKMTGTCNNKQFLVEARLIMLRTMNLLKAKLS